jgi:hypothetical protein
VIGAVGGERATLPEGRAYVVVPHGFAEAEPVDLGVLEPGAEHRVRLGGERADGDVQELLFALLDRAHLANPVKNAIYDAVLAAPTPRDAALELIGMELSPAVLGAVTELLLAR